MFRPQVILILAFSILAGAAVAAEQPPAPQKSPTTAKPASAAGSVVFIDPVTGKIRQPDASEIGALAPAAAAPSAAPKAPTEPSLIQGLNGAVGIKLGEDTFSYAVATITPEGSVAVDCVSGDQNAAKRVVAAKPAPAPTAETKVKDSRNARDPR